MFYKVENKSSGKLCRVIIFFTHLLNIWHPLWGILDTLVGEHGVFEKEESCVEKVSDYVEGREYFRECGER